jgi:hypothetical protein
MMKPLCGIRFSLILTAFDEHKKTPAGFSDKGF